MTVAGGVAAALVAVPPATLAQGRASGAVEGVVTLLGDTHPTATRVMNSTDPEVCGEEHSLEDLTISAEGRVRNAVVSLSGVPPDLVPARSARSVVIDNRDCRFEPHVLVAVAGDTLVARNRDALLHTTHYYGSLRSNVALARQGMAVPRVTTRPGLITVLCDVHGWMKAYVYVDDHPFHAVTGTAGRFRIEGVPPGEYTLTVWHERLGRQEIGVRVEAGTVTRVEPTFALAGSISPQNTKEGA